MKRLSVAAVCMSIMLLFSLGASAYAGKAESGREVTYSDDLVSIPVPEEDSFGFTDDYTRRKVLTQESDMPSSFSLKDEGYVTPVKLQSPFGTCWAFAAIASAESSIISSGLAGPDLDLSEKHVAYFAATAVNDPDSPQNGEGEFTDLPTAEKLNTGGVAFLASSVFANGMGPVIETADQPALLYRGEKGLKEYRYVDGKNKPYCYSANDNWDIPYDLRSKQDFSLKESYILPTPAKIENGNYSYEESATAAIKEQLLAGRAVEIGFIADKATPDQEHVESVSMSDDWANYGAQIGYANHAVTIVGWDDSIGSAGSPVQYKEGEKPEGPGAWLVKNSWGAGTEEFPNYGDGNWGFPIEITDENGEKKTVASGYFWLSYYDRSIFKPQALAFEKADPDLMMTAHDYMPANDIIASEYKDETKMGNIFQTEQSEQLEQIAFYTTHPGCSVHYEVYLMNAFFEDYTNGMKVAEGDGYFRYGGFHKVKLDTPVTMFRGQIYTIVVTEKTADGMYTVAIPSNFSDNYKGIINENESGIYMEGAWQDLSDEALQKKLGVVEEYPDQVFDNLPIKGYTRSLEYDFAIDIGGDTKLSFLPGKESTVITPHIEGSDDAAAENLKLRWSLDKDGIVDMETADNGYTVKLSVRRDSEGMPIEGTVYLIADAYVGDTYIGRFTAKIEAYRPRISNIFCMDEKLADTGETTYTGKSFRPAVEVMDEEGRTMEQGVDYTLKYRKNRKCGQAVVTATAAGIYAPGSISWRFVIRPAKAKINRLVSGKGRLAVKVKSQKASGITGYQIKYRVKGTKKWHKKTIKSAKNKLVLKKLKKGKRYQIKVRAYVKIKGKKVYGAFSKKKVSKSVK